MAKARSPKDKPTPGSDPKKQVGVESPNPLPDDYKERHPEDDEAHSQPRAPEE